jgi:hypothetical protein
MINRSLQRRQRPWGVGRALQGDATAEMMGCTVREILGLSRYREATRAIARDVARVSDAAGTASEIADLLKARRYMARLSSLGFSKALAFETVRT